MFAGCSDKADDVDPRFAADTYDEYTEPLIDAVIGTPAGTTVLRSGASITSGATGPTGAAGASGTLPKSGGMGVDGGVATGTGAVGGLTGGVTGVGGSFGGGMGPGNGKGGEGGQAGGVFSDGGVGGPGGVSGTAGFGFWHFDDCSPTSHFLVDSSGFGANAQQALKADCVTGISNLGVRIRSVKDIIQVPDEPQFTVSNRVAVAAWVHPDTVSGDQPIVIKRLNNQTSFSLGIHNGSIQMSVVLTTGRTIISSAPISAGVWTHVAGMYDGTFVFLFINGQQFGQVFAGGTLRNVFAPLRFGATTQTQFFKGILDEVFVSTQDISKDVLTALACIAQPSTFAVSPASSGPTPVDTNVHYDVAVSDNDVGFCQAKSYEFFLSFFDPNISTNVDFPPGSFQSASPGQTVTFGVDVSGTEDADPGIHQIPFEIFDFSQSFEQLLGQLTFDLAQPSGCFVSTKRELMITNTSVVDDPVRGTGDGAWSFGHLMRQMAPTADAAPAFVLQLFQHWLTDQTVNGFTVSARPAIQQQVLDIWPKTPSGDLDLDQPPFLLQAIVNRFDLRNLSAGSAGEGRIVYAFTPSAGPFGPGFGQNFTIIFEYNLQAQTDQDVTDWANRWHALSSHPFPSEDYNASLEAITRRFTERNAAPDNINGSDLMQLRTNEQILSPIGRWELREFDLSAATGLFDQATVKETPDLGFNGTQTFADFVNENEQAIINVLPGAPSHTVPLQFEGSNFLGGSVFNDLIEWNAPGIDNPDARFHASLNTCNGCHGPETNTSFLMVSPRFPGSESILSPFLTGTTVFDLFSGQQRTLNDLGRRKDDLTSIVCPSTGGAGGTSGMGGASGVGGAGGASASGAGGAGGTGGPAGKR
jgi:concanavalin A-like lectin/glucanase superfamily protein